MQKRVVSPLFEVVSSPEMVIAADIKSENSQLLELLLSEIPNDELSPLFQTSYQFVKNNYNCDFSFCCSINSDMKSNLLKKRESLNEDDYFFRLLWSNNLELEDEYRKDLGPLLTLSKDAQTLCLKTSDRYFFRIFLGEKEGQEFYYIFSNKLSKEISSPIFLQLKKFLQSRFSLFGEFESLNKFKELVYVDDVTELYNQRKLVKDLEHSSRKFHESQIPFAVLFIDIDHFKRVNDGHGHLTGTQLLADMAKLLKKILRESDLIYRYGGDEFVMILPHSTPNNAKKIASRILRAVKKEEFLKHSETPFKLSVSIGIAGVPTHALGPQELLAMADQMMYTAKSGGRGKICMAGELFE